MVAARSQATLASPHQATADHAVDTLVCTEAERIHAEGTAGKAETQAAVGCSLAERDASEGLEGFPVAVAVARDRHPGSTSRSVKGPAPSRVQPNDGARCSARFSKRWKAC